MMTDVPAHSQKVTHSYILYYPAHPARKDDPHYKDFEEYRRRTKETAKCAVGLHRDDFSECNGGLELHHAHVEFSLQNGVDLKWLEKDYPGISDPDQIGGWVESAENLEWLCEWHHRGQDGVHVATSSDFEASRYVRSLMKEALCCGSLLLYHSLLLSFSTHGSHACPVDMGSFHADRVAVHGAVREIPERITDA